MEHECSETAYIRQQRLKLLPQQSCSLHYELCGKHEYPKRTQGINYGKEHISVHMEILEEEPDNSFANHPTDLPNFVHIVGTAQANHK